MENTPFKVHVFVCTNNRNGSAKSCADGDAQQIKDELKRELKKNNLWGTTVRASTSGCLGNCAKGPNVFIYPAAKMITQCTLRDVPKILETIDTLIEES